MNPELTTDKINILRNLRKIKIEKTRTTNSSFNSIPHIIHSLFLPWQPI